MIERRTTRDRVSVVCAVRCYAQKRKIPAATIGTQAQPSPITPRRRSALKASAQSISADRASAAAARRGAIRGGATSSEEHSSERCSIASERERLGVEQRGHIDEIKRSPGIDREYYSLPPLNIIITLKYWGCLFETQYFNV